MKFSDNQIKLFRGISLGAGVFTLVVAFTMIFSLVQLKTIDPLNSPALLKITEQFDADPDNSNKAEQVRAMDLMARKAYFSSRWQVETGAYLLLTGAIIFVLFQRLIAGSEKQARSLQTGKPDIVVERIKSRRYLLISAASVTLLAVVSSFMLRSGLPAPGKKPSDKAGPAGAVVSASAVSLPDEASFPFFRGEGSRGTAGGSGYPTEWNGTDGKNIKWKTAVPATGKSSPVIWGDRIFLTGAGNDGLEVYCIDKKDGKILWKGSGSDFAGASAEVPESDAEAGMAVPTPAVNKDYVCAIFGNGNLVCFTHDGSLKWGKITGIPKGTYGFSASLLIYDKLVLVQYDSQDKITLSGYDLDTGGQKWETPRQGRPVNSSPVLATFEGQPQLLINGNPNVSSFDPVEGKELWSLPGVSGDVAPSLAVNSSIVYATTDYYKLIAMRPGKAGTVVWEDNTYTPDVSSPVANDNYLFVSTGSGDVACYNAMKGDTLWTHYFEGEFYASPIIAGDNVYLLDRSGVMHIVGADSGFKLVGECSLGERTDCTPAFSEKQIFIRTRDNLYCISGN
ncbi:MAG: PQQ-binding-like beta-propeller repeat protein [Bacteroidales bacterium]